MRNAIIEYARSLKSRTFGVSDELPFTSGNVLYLKNPKRVYVDMPQKINEQVIAVMGNHGVFQELLTVSAFFATDAKNLTQSYEEFVDQMRNAKNIENGETYFRREVDVITSYENDLLITQLEYRFTKLT